MSSYLENFSALYDPAMPGVVTVTPDGGTAFYAQFWRDADMEADGIVRVMGTRARIQAPALRFGDLTRGDQVDIGSESYRCVTGPVDDGHGIADVYLEPVA